MSEEIDDPFAGELEQDGGGRRKRKAAEPLIAPEDAGEGDVDLDLALAFQPMNDFGNANRLIRRYGEDLMFVKNVGWFAWDGARWDRERGDGEFTKRGHLLSKAIRGEFRALKEKKPEYAEVAGKLWAWGVQSGNTARINGMMAAAEPYLSQPIDSLDAEPFLVVAQNGTIELGQHAELRKSRREDRITRILGAGFDTRARRDRWDGFIARVLPDAEIRDFVQRFMGYCLTGETNAHLLLILYGLGRNGKTVFMNIMRRILADYATSLPAASILAKREGASGSEASPDLADLPGVRLVTVSEPPEGGRLDESRIKEITGGEFAMKVRHLNKGFFEFRPQFKMMIATNHRPTIRGTDKGIWSRIALIPFTAQIPESEIDPGLEEKLWAERDGILQWLLTGAEEWRVRGLALPQKIKDAVEDYRADQDPVGEFLKARCEVCPESINPATDKPFEVTAKRLREAYVEWCKEEGLDPMGGKAFGSKLTGMGIQRRKSNGNKIYIGLHINADPVDLGQG